ncbi:hypothetical protein SNEBB_009462 [Seison nebaliae]|nr:hypothetical protein SNEBB_009462 [Seison nebaliae]
MEGEELPEISKFDEYRPTSATSRATLFKAKSTHQKPFIAHYTKDDDCILYPTEKQNLEKTVAPKLPKVKELKAKDAREALIIAKQHNPVHGTVAARKMNITNIRNSNAFIYSLETIYQKRSSSRTFAPYKSGKIDGVNDGQTPLPWDVQERNEKQIEIVKVPYSDVVLDCHECNGEGNISCGNCKGLGSSDCPNCSSAGKENCRTNDPGYASHKKCTQCKGKKHLQCKCCKGLKRLRWYVEITIRRRTQKNNYIYEKLSERAGQSIPKKKIEAAEAKIIFSGFGNRVEPLTDFEIDEINKESKKLHLLHSQNTDDYSIIKQTHKLAQIPISECEYVYGKDVNHFFVYGTERRTFTPKYPKSCCCGLVDCQKCVIQ